MASLPLLLFIEDDDLVRRALSRTLRGHFSITPYASAEPALRDVDAGKVFDAILCDLNLTGMSGEQMYAELGFRSPAFPPRVVILTGTVLRGVFAEALGVRFMTKPCSSSLLIQVLLAVAAPFLTTPPDAPKVASNVQE